MLNVLESRAGAGIFAQFCELNCCHLPHKAQLCTVTEASPPVGPTVLV